MADIPVVHLPDRDYDDEAARRDWRKQGYAVTSVVDGHPVREPCPACSAAPVRPLDAGPPQPLTETEQARWAAARDETLAALMDDLARVVVPADPAAALSVARRIFRYGMTVGWDRAVAAAPPEPGPPPSADAMRDHG